MGRTRQLAALILLPLCLLVSGCATGSYMADRGHDLADIVTMTAGKGLGASVHAGPIHGGLFVGKDQVGLRGGALRTKWSQESSFGWAGLFDPLIAFPGGDMITTGGEWFRAPFDGSKIAEQRGKLYEAEGIAPFLMIPNQRTPAGSNPAYYFTQIEASLGLGLTVRLGLNPGELVDFLFGWFGIDIYSDDLRGRMPLDKTPKR